MSIQCQVPLDDKTTFGCKSVAQYFARAESLDDLRVLYKAAGEKNLPVHLLGGGANTIARARVEGLVIQVAIGGGDFTVDAAGRTLYTAGAGRVMDEVIGELTARGASGLENLSLIPGTVGGAVVQNIGAYGMELSERLDHVTVYDPDADTVFTLDNAACDFSYRHSVFKTDRARRWVIVSATFVVPETFESVTGYKDIDAALDAADLTPETVSAAQMRELVINIRRRKLPDPAQIGNAGSFFTNPIVGKVKWRELLTLNPSLVSYDVGGGRKKLAAAWLIQAAGFKGAHLGPVGVYDKHALILVNRGGATGEDVLAARDAIVEKVKALYGVTLAMEPVVL